MKKIILFSLLILTYSVGTCAGIAIVKPLKAINFFSNNAGTMVPNLLIIDFTGNTTAQLGFSPTFTGTKNVSCENSMGSGTFSTPVAMNLTNGIGYFPCFADKDYSSQLSSIITINFKIGAKTFSAKLDITTPEFDETMASNNNAFDGAETVDISNPATVKITLKEGNLYEASRLLSSYNDFHYSVRYKSNGEDYIIEGSVNGPYLINDGGSVDIILGEDIADIVAAADPNSVKLIGYFLGVPTSGKAHKLLTGQILLK